MLNRSIHFTNFTTFHIRTERNFSPAFCFSIQQFHNISFTLVSSCESFHGFFHIRFHIRISYTHPGRRIRESCESQTPEWAFSRISTLMPEAHSLFHWNRRPFESGISAPLSNKLQTVKTYKKFLKFSALLNSKFLAAFETVFYNRFENDYNSTVCCSRAAGR
jgi:hypothetical protein